MIIIKNQGKIFEEQIKKSIPEYALLFRLHDAAQSFDNGSTLRFSLKNSFDFILWDSKNKFLYALELKTVKGKSIEFERSKDEKSSGIHFHQIQGLNSWDRYDGTICGFIVEFRELEKTVFISISEFNKIMDRTQKKSFRYDDLDILGIKYSLIGQKKARTRYTYDIDGLLTSMKC